MSDLVAARWQMGLSLAFHIVFAAVGIAMPLLMIAAEWVWLRRGDPVAKELAVRWSKGVAVLFAVGAVSGTVLSFELGLLWPKFMAVAGPVIGLPFALEGFAFFFEAIALGLYLYGWDRLSPAAHWACGAVVLLSGVLSGLFVVSANGWMNAPAGFVLEGERLVSVDPWRAMLNEAALGEGLHMSLAAFAAVGFAVAGIHAWLLLKNPAERLHRLAFGIALSVGGAAALLQPLVGDSLARSVARRQPLKLAALEGQWETERGAPLRLGGWPDESAETTRWSLEIPKALSWLAFRDFDAEVVGLKSVPREDRPPVRLVHVAFQLMVGCGSLLALTSLLGACLWKRDGGLPTRPWFLRLVCVCGPLGLLATEAGWIVTEAGRQPWIIYGVMRVEDAVTPMPGLVVPLTVFALVYLLLAGTVVVALKRQIEPTIPGTR